MSKAVKWVVGGVALVVIVLVVVVAAAFLFVDAAAKLGIEKGGTVALGVPTTLKSADVGVFSGTFKMRGLSVGNPKGFAAPHFLTLGDGSVAVSVGTLTKDTVELPELRLEHIDVQLEKKDGKSNYNVILDNLKNLSGGGGDKGGGKPAPAPAPKQGGEQGKKFVIKELAIRDVTVHLDLLGIGGVVSDATKLKVDIDAITLHNVGQTGKGVGGTGVTMGQLSGLVVQAVLAAAVEKGGGLIPDDVLGELKGGLAGVGDIAGSLTDMGMNVAGTVGDIGGKATEAAGKAVEEGKKAIEDVGKGVTDLLGGGKKKEEKKKP